MLSHPHGFSPSNSLPSFWSSEMPCARQSPVVAQYWGKKPCNLSSYGWDEWQPKSWTKCWCSVKTQPLLGTNNCCDLPSQSRCVVPVECGDRPRWFAKNGWSGGSLPILRHIRWSSLKGAYWKPNIFLKHHVQKIWESAADPPKNNDLITSWVTKNWKLVTWSNTRNWGNLSVVVVVSGRQPAPHRSEVVKTP